MVGLGEGSRSQRIGHLRDLLTYVGAVCGDNASLLDTSLFNDNLGTISVDTSVLANRAQPLLATFRRTTQRFEQ